MEPLAQNTPGRVRLGPKCREEINAEIDTLLYRLKTEPNLPRRQAVLKRIGSLAALLAQAFAMIAVALLPFVMTSPPSRIARRNPLGIWARRAR
jgi:hypothetical protein